MDEKVSFNKNFEILQRNAEALRDDDNLDIDSLIPLVEESTKAYQVCKSRIEEVKLALSKHLQGLDTNKASENDDLSF